MINYYGGYCEKKVKEKLTNTKLKKAKKKSHSSCATH